MKDYIIIEKSKLDMLISQVKELVSEIKSLNNNLNIAKESDDNDIIDVEAASKLLNISKPTIYLKVSKRQIPYMKNGKKLLFSKKEILQLIRSNRVKTISELEKKSNKGGNYDA